MRDFYTKLYQNNEKTDRNITRILNQEMKCRKKHRTSCNNTLIIIIYKKGNIADLKTIN